MDGEAGWWTTSGNIGLPPLARAMGVGRQQQQEKVREKSGTKVDVDGTFDCENLCIVWTMTMTTFILKIKTSLEVYKRYIYEQIL